MPVPPDHPFVLRTRTFWKLGSDLNAQSRMHFAYTGTAPSDASCVTLATSAYASAVTNLVPLLGTESSLAGVEFTDLTSTSAGTGEHLHDTTGTRSGSDTPAGAAVLMNIQISRRYRGGKPRVYWPLGTASDIDTPTNWLSGSVSAFLAGVAQYIDDIIALTNAGTTLGPLVNISNYASFNTVGPDLEGRFKYPPKLRAVAISPDVFAGISINPRIASQRRRNLMGQ
jgi:hypothetical protein